MREGSRGIHVSSGGVGERYVPLAVDTHHSNQFHSEAAHPPDTCSTLQLPHHHPRPSRARVRTGLMAPPCSNAEYPRRSTKKWTLSPWLARILGEHAALVRLPFVVVAHFHLLPKTATEQTYRSADLAEGSGFEGLRCLRR